MGKYINLFSELETHYDRWLFVLKNLPLLDEIPEKLKQSIFMKLFETADTTQYNNAMLSQYQDSLREYRDLKNSLDTAFEDGFQDGAKKIAMNAIKEGFDDNVIAKITGLPLEQIAQLRKETN